MFGSDRCRTGFLLLILLVVCRYDIALAGKKVTVDSITPYFAEYELRRAGMKLAMVNYALWKDGDTYIYETSGQPRGIARLFGKQVAREEARFRVHDEKIIQQHYSYVIENGDNKRNRSIEFDWTGNRATIRRDDSERQIVLKQGMVDRSLLQLKVVLDLANGRLASEYTAIARKRPRSYHFAKTGTETVTTPAGTYKTVVITITEKRSKGDRVTRYWCAGQLSMLPVKIQQFRDGDGQVEMNLLNVRGLR